jgi:hypothetical protein
MKVIMRRRRVPTDGRPDEGSFFIAQQGGGQYWTRPLEYLP